MWSKIKHVFTPPVFEDEDKTRVANLLSITLLTLFLIAVARTVLGFWVSREFLAAALSTSAMLIVVFIGVFALMRAGHVRLGSVILTLFQWTVTAWLTYRYGGVGISSYGIFTFVIFVSGLLLGGKWAIGYAAVSVVYGALLLYLDSRGIVVPISESAISAFNTVTPSFITTAVLGYLYHRGITRALARARNNERAMAEHAAQMVRTNEQLAHEISERERLEERLLHARKMEAIGRLSGGIAHDFNNLLVPIIGYVDLALMDLSPDDKLYADLQEVRQAADRAAGLTRQILAFSRQQVLTMEVLDLNKVILKFTRMIRRLIGEDVELETSLAAQLDRVQADRVQLEQVLMNLVVNARDAMPDGGKLIVETANVFLDEDYVAQHAHELAPGPYVMLAVSDTGHGMDAETKGHIFEPFFTTKERGKGTGLGLATVFGIVKQHEGSIWVYSEPDRGTTVKIYLPQAQVPDRAVERVVTETSSAYGTETVLVVEDEGAVRRLVCETLGTYGYHVIEAKGPDEGLELAAACQDTIHLLLTDVIMPGMNGRELYQQVVALYPNIGVLYMSGYTDNVIAHHGVLHEGTHFLQKPFEVRALAQKVREALGSGSG